MAAAAVAAAEVANTDAAEAATVAAAEATEGFTFLTYVSADEVRDGEQQRATGNGEVISLDDNDDDDDDDDDDINEPDVPSSKRMRMVPSPPRAPWGAPRAAAGGGSGSNTPGRAVHVEMC